MHKVTTIKRLGQGALKLSECTQVFETYDRQARDRPRPDDLEARLGRNVVLVMSSIDYLRIFSDSDGCSHFDASNIELKMNDYAPPATPLNTSPAESDKAMVFLELPVEWFGDWHPTPVKQWLFLLTGGCEFEAGDGERCRRKAGEVVMLDDMTGKGHRTRVIGDSPVRIAAVHCQ